MSAAYDYPALLDEAIDSLDGILFTDRSDACKRLGHALGILRYLADRVPPQRTVFIRICMDCKVALDPLFFLADGKDSLIGEPAARTDGICDPCDEVRRRRADELAA